jgi:hypothetical protein
MAVGLRRETTHKVFARGDFGKVTTWVVIIEDWVGGLLPRSCY